MKATSSIRGIISIVGENIEPEKLSLSTGIPYSSMGRKGQSHRVMDEGFWEYDTGYIQTNNIEEIFVILEKIFLPKSEVIRKYIDEYQLYCKLSIIVDAVNGRVPGVFFNRKVLNFLHEINAEIDVDIYIT
jgi:hypothetical protein